MDTNYTDNFIDDGVPSLDQSVPQHVSWRDLPDREEGLGELLNGIWNVLTVQHSGMLLQPTVMAHQLVILLPLWIKLRDRLGCITTHCGGFTVG